MTPTYSWLRVWVNTTLVQNPIKIVIILPSIDTVVFLAEYSVLLLAMRYHTPHLPFERRPFQQNRLDRLLELLPGPFLVLNRLRIVDAENGALLHSDSLKQLILIVP